MGAGWFSNRPALIGTTILRQGGMRMQSTTMTTGSELYFSIHGIGLRYRTNSSTLRSPATGLLEYFGRDRLEESASLTITFEAVNRRADIPMSVPHSAETIFEKCGVAAGDRLRETWHCTMQRHDHRLIADFHDQGWIAVDPTVGTAEGYVIRPEAMHPDILESYVHFMLAELLRYQGLYSLHATALERQGRGLLIPGYSGRGKTTTFLSLLRSGYRYLSDDHPFVTDRDGRLEVLAMPLKVDVTDHTISFFPELRHAPAGILHVGPQKRFFQVEEVYPSGIGSSCEPAVILFPHVVDAPRSTLEPLPRSRVLEELLPQGLFAYDRDIAARQFRVLSKLAQQVRCYRLYFGRDVLALPELITPLLER